MSSILFQLLSRLPPPFRGLRERFDTRPIRSVETLVHFLHTRSAYVAQTSMHGYLKARMGTRFRELFVDDQFSLSIRVASIRLFLSCLGDLTVFAAGHCLAAGAASRKEDAELLATGCFEDAADRCLTESDWTHAQPDALAAFRNRVACADWAEAVEGSNAFRRSARDLVAFAPVIDEFKALDRDILDNSISLRWIDVRRQARKRMDADGIWRDWSRRREAVASRAETGYDRARPKVESRGT